MNGYRSMVKLNWSDDGQNVTDGLGLEKRYYEKDRTFQIEQFMTVIPGLKLMPIIYSITSISISLDCSLVNLSVTFRPSRSVRHVPSVTFRPSCFFCHVPSVTLHPSRSVRHIPSVMFCQSRSIRHVLSVMFCPSQV